MEGFKMEKEETKMDKEEVIIEKKEIIMEQEDTEVQKEGIKIEKENDKVEGSERLIKDMSRNDLSEIKEELKTKLVHSEGVWAKLETRFDELKVCVVKMTNVIEECKNLIQSERHETKDIQHVLKDKASKSTCKTNIVSPMIGGIPLKRARISLERLGPAPYNISQLAHSRGANSSQPHASASSDRVQQNASVASEAGPSRTRGNRRS